ncbi:hypothetical protein HMPREF0908_1129, partial [Selenomonas flueggei ATCC 43531]
MSEAKYRITDLAKEFKTDKGTIIDILKSKNYKVKNMFSAVGEEERAAVKAELGRTAKPVRKESLPSKAASKSAAPKATAPKKPVEKADDTEKPAVKAPSAPTEEKERPVLRARTKAPGIVIVRQAPAKTAAEAPQRRSSAGAAGGSASRSARPAGRSGNARPAAPAMPAM